jgi:hypothetical protein
MPIEIKVLLMFGLCCLLYEGINLYIKRRVIKIIKIINEKEQR